MRQSESKLKLLRTAHELISQQSYGSVGVDQICEQSGVKKGSFYHFFRSKSELTVAAYEYHWAILRRRWNKFSLRRSRRSLGWMTTSTMCVKLKVNDLRGTAECWAARSCRSVAS